MQPMARVEVALIIATTAVIAVLSRHLPASLELGSLFAISALILLVQGLFRDLWLLRQQRKSAPANQPVAMKCMCLESTLGLGGVLVGVILTAVGVTTRVPIAEWVWPILTGSIMTFGFLTRDVVITWSPWGIKKHPGHGSILVVWR